MHVEGAALTTTQDTPPASRDGVGASMALVRGADQGVLFGIGEGQRRARVICQYRHLSYLLTLVHCAFRATATSAYCSLGWSIRSRFKPLHQCGVYPSLVRPAFLVAAQRLRAASAILRRPSALIFLRLRGTADCASVDFTCLGAPPRFLGSVPSIERTAAICSSIVFICASKPAREAVSISRESAGCVGIRPVIHACTDTPATVP